MNFTKMVMPSWILPVIFTTIALIFGLVMINLTPPMWGVDETEHFPRAYQIAEGNFKQDPVTNGFGGLMPYPVVDLYFYAKRDLSDDKSPQQDVNNEAKYESFQEQSLNVEREQLNFIGAGVYSPLAYVAPASGIAVSKLFDSTLGSAIFAARLASLILYVVLVGAALYLLRDSQAKWIVFVIGLMPTAVTQASVVTVDAILIAFSLLFFAQLARVLTKKSKITSLDLLSLTVIAIMLTLTKPNYFILSLAIYAIPASRLIKHHKLFAYFLFPFLVLLPAIVWNLQIRELVALSGEIQRGIMVNVNSADQIFYILTHPFHFIYSIVVSALLKDWPMSLMSTLNFNFVQLPSIVLASLSSLMVVVGLAAATHRRLNFRSAMIILITSMVALIGVAASLYAVFTEVGASVIEGVQGRYFIALLPFIVYSATSLVPMRFNIGDKALGILCGALVVANLLLAVLWYAQMTY